MNNVLALAAKETRSFFNSWMGVFVCVFFLLLSGIFFSLLVLDYARFSAGAAKENYQGLEALGLSRFVFSTFLLNMSVVLMFLAPLLTMRSFSEEKKMRTLELLFTYPFSDFEIVAGKFLGAVSVFAMLFLPTAAYLGILRWLGGELDWGPILLGYLGFWLLGNAYLALGLFISSLTESQVASAVITFTFLILFWMMDWFSSLAGPDLAQFIRALSPLNHYREFTRGILDLSHAAYFVFFNLYFLFLSIRAVETRNWKG